ncbi:DUF4139 domain-containing protein [Sphingomonas alpina]|uniref:DUF4139 domain-containing protein n=1 Tax=Sphingomonas alpina TaxID=653931 RepID=A0A7H0LGE5_9SPHN|nr:hypothetical protein [Sphingomonas alpina]QNQ08748.1 hypothetical protein H3Z74_18780 [Sphingomonas alpina]
MHRIAVLSALFLTAAPAAAQTPVASQAIVNSERVDKISVTLYREPGRGERAIGPGWPGGYALITETRTITLPAGRSTIRFAGVSEGMMPETAIVTGLPRRVNEKNRDARLLGPATLVDAYLKRSVTIRRTSRATGKTTTEEAVIQSGPAGGVVITTAAGAEALSCSGLPESLSYPGVPGDLAAKPTLSVTTDNAVAATATVQLSYLAQGFDWSANYVARIGDDGETLDLFAWLTAANGGSQGFADADTQAVAGGLHREAAARLPKGPAPQLHLKCWPMDITSTYPKWSIERAPPPRMDEESEDLVVTGSRRERMMMRAMAPPPPPPPPPPPAPVVMAQQEELGDLKLYRIPEPVTVAALSRKQVAMIDRKGVRFDRIYTGDFGNWRYRSAGETPPIAASLVLRTENLDTKGLGLPLPAGRVAVFESARNAPMLVAESSLADRAIGEEVEFGAGASNDIRFVTVALPATKQRAAFKVRVTNARATPETFELALPAKVDSASDKLIQRKGRKAWRVMVPANGSVSLDLAFDRRG